MGDRSDRETGEVDCDKVSGDRQAGTIEAREAKILD
jgi:hypothetical protein